MIIKGDPQLERLNLLIAGENSIPKESASNDIRERLLESIAQNSEHTFNIIVSEIERRKVGSGSEWHQDDYLVFLLLLGSRKFNLSPPFLKKLLEMRMSNANALPLKINEVFVALARNENGIDGDLGFLKVPFLHLLKRLKIDGDDAAKVLKQLSMPGLWTNLPPFLRLLAFHAHDIVLTYRQPDPIETKTQFFERLEALAKDLSFRDYFRIIGSLPVKTSWLFISTIITVLSGLAGISYQWGSLRAQSDNNKTRPEHLEIASVSSTGRAMPSVVESSVNNELKKIFLSGGKRKIAFVELAPITQTTSTFTIEVSHPLKPLNCHIAFAQRDRHADKSAVIIPTQQDGAKIRLLAPQLEAGSQICFFIQLDASESTMPTLENQLLIRSLP